MKKLLTLIAAIALIAALVFPAAAIYTTQGAPTEPPDAVRITVVIPYSDGVIATFDGVLPIYADYEHDYGYDQCNFLFLPTATITFLQDTTLHELYNGETTTFVANVAYPFSTFTVYGEYCWDFDGRYVDLIELNDDTWYEYAPTLTRDISELDYRTYVPPTPKPTPEPLSYTDITVTLPALGVVATITDVSTVYYDVSDSYAAGSVFIVTLSSKITFEEDGSFYDPSNEVWNSFTAGRAYKLLSSYDDIWAFADAENYASVQNAAMFIAVDGPYYDSALNYLAASIFDIEYNVGATTPTPRPSAEPTERPTAKPDTDDGDDDGDAFTLFGLSGIILYIAIGAAAIVVLAVVVIIIVVTSEKKRRLKAQAQPPQVNQYAQPNVYIPPQPVAPTYNAPPVQPTAPPTYEVPTEPTYVAPEPTYVAPTEPTYTAPEPTYVAPTEPTYTAPEPTYVAPPVQPAQPAQPAEPAEAAVPAPTATVEDSRVCPNCGAELRPGKAFCGNCGTRVAE
ncbi:MAG: zinc-ribbon domain-containing protein [Oscillospiraceae bacterium]|jgi:hypothetical protein|nr:zinc-ribbon domain-containing protein [Oscillospiraceae bacterium]